MLSEAARRGVLERLLALDHERSAEEVKQGLHDKKKPANKAGGGRKKKTADQGSLFERGEGRAPMRYRVEFSGKVPGRSTVHARSSEA
jgi:hypothetical protein